MRRDNGGHSRRRAAFPPMAVQYAAKVSIRSIFLAPYRKKKTLGNGRVNSRKEL